MGAKTLYIESFNGELLDKEVFYTLKVRVLTDRFRQTCDRVRPHNLLGYRPPTPMAVPPIDLVPILVSVTNRWYNYQG